MTPKEKAIELYEKFYYQLPSSLSDKIQDCVAQECALIMVDEILNEYWAHDTKRRDWWLYVKLEIENL